MTSIVSDLPGRQSGAFRRYLALLECLADSAPGASIRSIGQRAGLSPATANRLLHELLDLGVVVEDPVSGRYMVSYRLARLVEQSGRHERLKSVALPEMQDLRDRFGETVTLVVPIGRERVCILEVESRHPAHFGAVVGIPERLDAGAPGKLLVAFLPAPSREAFLAMVAERDGLAAADRLRQFVEDLPARGAIVGQVERAPEFNVVSVPILGPAGILAALQIVGPASRWSIDLASAALPVVLRAAKRIAMVFSSIG